MPTGITGVVQRRKDEASTPVELYTDAVERAESAVVRLKSIEAPAFAGTSYRATESILRAVRDLNYAIACIESAERLERDDENE